MVETRPFRGIVYNRERFRNISPLIAPPYDVISNGERKRLMAKSQFNIVHLTLGDTDPHGNVAGSFYSDSSEKWRAWREDGVLTRQEVPAIWRLDETFVSLDDRRVTRTGFIALIRLEECSTGGVQRHEQTFGGPREDRLRLIESTRAHLSPIFFAFKDDENRAPSLMENFRPSDTSVPVKSHDGAVEIAFSCTTDEGWINELCTLLNRSTVVIADGHHRYDAALAFHRKQGNSSRLDSSFTMGYFVPSSSEGLQIYPVHRGFLHLPESDKRRLDEGIERFFEVNTFNSGPSRFPSFTIARPGKDPISIRPRATVFKNLEQRLSPPALASVGSVVFDEIILKRILGQKGSDIRTSPRVRYYHRSGECLSHLNEGLLQVAFLIPPIPVETLFSIVSQDGVLPAKSTYFYPKCPTGVVMHSLLTR